MRTSRDHRRVIIVPLAAALVAGLGACGVFEDESEPTVAPFTTVADPNREVVGSAPAVPAGTIAGFGVAGQPRSWGSDGSGLRPAIERLVDDVGATMFRLEVDRGNTDWEVDNDDDDPFHIEWAAFDEYFADDDFTDLWDYTRYLNSLGVTDVQFALEGLLPEWMGATEVGRGMEDEYVETVVAFLLYARTRAPEPRPRFNRVNPWTEADLGQLESFKLGLDGQVSLLRRLVDRMNQFPELDDLEIVAPESSSEEFAVEFHELIQDEPALLARLSATAFHRYGGYAPGHDWTDATPPGWMTEFNSGAAFFTDDGEWRDTFCYTVKWRDAMFASGNLLAALESGVTSALYYADVDAPHIHSLDDWETFGLLAATLDGETVPCGSVGQPPDDELDRFVYVDKPSYHAVKHVYAHVHPGAQLIASTADEEAALLAFRNRDGSVVVVGQNDATARDVGLEIGGDVDVDGAQMVVSTDGSYHVDDPDGFELVDGELVLRLPDRSVVTWTSG